MSDLDVEGRLSHAEARIDVLMRDNADHGKAISDLHVSVLEGWSMLEKQMMNVVSELKDQRFEDKAHHQQQHVDIKTAIKQQEVGMQKAIDQQKYFVKGAVWLGSAAVTLFIVIIKYKGDILDLLRGIIA